MTTTIDRRLYQTARRAKELFAEGMSREDIQASLPGPDGTRLCDLALFLLCSDKPEFEKRLSARDRVTNILRGGAMQANEIAKTLSLGLALVRTTLSRNKRFKKLGSGLWGLDESRFIVIT